MMIDEILHKVEENGVEFSSCQVTEMNLTLAEDIVMIVRIEQLWNCVMLSSKFPHLTFHSDGTKTDHSYYWPNGMLNSDSDEESLSNAFPRQKFTLVAMLDLDVMLKFVKRMR